MNRLIEHLKSIDNLLFVGNIEEELIEESENRLGLKFAEEYHNYVKEYGVISFSSHELTGICNLQRLNVVDVTLREKEQVEVPEDFYVVEETGIDGIVIWQNTAGEIFATQSGLETVKISDSLVDYLTDNEVAEAN